MKKKILVIMSIGLALITTMAGAVDKTTVASKLRAKKIDNTVKKSTGKNNTPGGKYTMTELTKNIEYDFARSSIRGVYNTKLDQLAGVLIQNKSALSLRGYADSVGSYKGNWVISDKRAKAVKNYLVSKGVDSAKIVATPFGSAKPVASNKTKAGRQKNRRVEIKITDISN